MSTLVTRQVGNSHEKAGNTKTSFCFFLRVHFFSFLMCCLTCDYFDMAFLFAEKM